MKRSSVATVAALTVFLIVQLGTLALVQPFESAGYQTVEDPSDPTNSLLYLVAILVATGVMLAAFKFGVDGLVRGLIVFSSSLLSYYVFSVLLPPAVRVGGANALAVGGALVVAVALLVHPEWYVIDGVGVVMGMGAAALFGISFGLLPAIVLLTALAVYDAVSVYGTEHMLTLADGVMALKIPVVLVIPLTLGYSFLDEGEGDEGDGNEQGGTPEGAATDGSGRDGSGKNGEDARERPAPDERDVFFIGLGDAVMPTIIVASAAFFLDAPSLGVPGLALTLPALTAILGTLAGLVVLVRMVMKGRAHAGLPLLNGGAIGGYLVGALASGIPLTTVLGLGPYL
ncbi:presenilin family intramembrane aspartyl protease PSH [Halomarina litorea]|uniref:presenilin family intramembrane aspartyl protease PSH n=1 Tax=Halomarina litorea TaxID=2961595 RepID=UPI0020C3614E|nr:presenilin family intramembrane aspartyl protease PSH [Halomarina sp. BCD28]